MKKVVVLLVCAVVLLVGDKSGIESSFDVKKAYEQGIAFYNNKEYDKAAELLKKACDGGNMRGCYNLGVMYSNGNGVEKNKQKAAELYKKVCDGGDMDGCYNLGTIYANGNGVEKNKQKAAELYKKVCDGGDMDGCYNLGTIYANGNGVEK
ncbi:MAG: sel1 repeat family protein, partial [Campylobacter sp.]|uniref:tetratricopeptide repeat protein n=1 Tax=Campylobacter sp. TaxID=205 RepID=UPI002AA7E024